MTAEKRLKAIRMGQISWDTLLENLFHAYLDGKLSRRKLIEGIVYNEIESIKTNPRDYLDVIYAKKEEF